MTFSIFQLRKLIHTYSRSQAHKHLLPQDQVHWLQIPPSNSHFSEVSWLKINLCVFNQRSIESLRIEMKNKKVLCTVA